MAAASGIDSERYEGNSDFFLTRQQDDLLIAVYVLIANEITTYSSGCCCTSWPWALPDPQALAIVAHKKFEKQLLHAYFRDESLAVDSDGYVRGMINRLRINYGPISPKPASSASDVEAPADPAPRE